MYNVNITHAKLQTPPNIIPWTNKSLCSKNPLMTFRTKFHFPDNFSKNEKKYSLNFFLNDIDENSLKNF